MISQYRKGTEIKMINFEEELNNAFPVNGVNIDFSGLTMYATKGTSTVKPERGDKDGHNAGNAAGIKAAEQITGRSHAQWHDR